MHRTTAASSNTLPFPDPLYTGPRAERRSCTTIRKSHKVQAVQYRPVEVPGSGALLAILAAQTGVPTLAQSLPEGDYIVGYELHRLSGLTLHFIHSSTGNCCIPSARTRTRTDGTSAPRRVFWNLQCAPAVSSKGFPSFLATPKITPKTRARARIDSRTARKKMWTPLHTLLGP